MDHLALIAVRAELARELPGSVLREFRQETEHRFRAVFERADRRLAVVVSIRPRGPWIGRPAPGSRARRDRTTAFAAGVRRALADRVLAKVGAGGPDRSVRLEFAGGPVLVAELAPHLANLLLLDEDGRVVATARRPKSQRSRIEPGTVYRAAAPPSGALAPLDASAEQIEHAWRAVTARSGDPGSALRSVLLGVDDVGARLLLDEARASGRSPGDVLRSHVDRLVAGTESPVVEVVAPGAGRSLPEPDAAVLLPWDPVAPAGRGRERIRRDGAAATVGWFHDAVERLEAERERRSGLLAILRREIRRQERLLRRVEADRRGFEDPDVHRRHGEALLAGMHAARREGDHALVPDPYDPEGAWIAVPVPAAVPLARAADDLFARHRRAVRGLRAAEARMGEIASRIGRLVRLEREAVEADSDGNDRLEASMREEGIAVGLGEQRRARAGDVASRLRPRVAGVRIFRSGADDTILVGKTARDNQYLTFRVGGPEDFWLHAQGVTGAHVLIRNPDRRRRPDERSLHDAAVLAAWFSDARSQPRVDVQWTRRKYVRKARGGPPGAVIVKRFETVRVIPREPEGDAGGDGGGRGRDGRF